MVGKRWSQACAIAAACIALAGTAEADVTWVVNGAFDDGGTVSGHFSIDVYGFLDSNFNLLTTAGGTLPGFDYTAADSYYSNGTFYVDFQPGYYQDLHLTFAANLNFPVSNNPLLGGLGGPSWECALSYSCYVPEGGLTRYISSGSATGSVPELSTWGMMALGFAGLGLAGYRKIKSGQPAFAA
jgi:hypothetical protein